MATSTIKNPLAVPAFGDASEIYSHTGTTTTETVTIPADGWYTIVCKGWWGVTQVYINHGTTKVPICVAQVTASNVFVMASNVMPLREGTVLRLQIENSAGEAHIYKNL